VTASARHDHDDCNPRLTENCTFHVHVLIPVDSLMCWCRYTKEYERALEIYGGQMAAFRSKQTETTTARPECIDLTEDKDSQPSEPPPVGAEEASGDTAAAPAAAEAAQSVPAAIPRAVDEVAQTGWERRLSSESGWLREGEAEDVFTGRRLRERMGMYVTQRDNETPKQVVAQLPYAVSLPALLEANNVRFFAGELKANSRLRKKTSLLIPGTEESPDQIMEGVVVAARKDYSLWMVGYDNGEVMELELSEVREACWCFRVHHEGWSVAPSHPFAGALLRRTWRVDGELHTVNGYVGGYLPPGDSAEDHALWHAMHEDGDDEDLEEAEVQEAIQCHSEWAAQQQQTQEEEVMHTTSTTSSPKRAAPDSSSRQQQQKKKKTAKSSEASSTDSSSASNSAGCKLQLSGDSDAGSDIGDLASPLSVTSETSEVGCVGVSSTDIEVDISDSLSLRQRTRQHQVLKVRYIDKIMDKRVVWVDGVLTREYLVNWAGCDRREQTWESPVTFFNSGTFDLLKSYVCILAVVCACWTVHSLQSYDAHCCQIRSDCSRHDCTARWIHRRGGFQARAHYRCRPKADGRGWQDSKERTLIFLRIF
jgi:hypothetical protein